jgi:hypothetical protein
VLTAEPTIVTAPIRSQFKRLLQEPLNAAQGHSLGPIIVILDALDECGDPGSREGLLSLLVEEFPKLPSVFRFLVTSRPASDIASQFYGQSHIREMQLDITTEATKQDITVYVGERMCNIRLLKRSLEPDWPGSPIIKTLADYSGGLFIWATTSCNFISNFDPKSRLAVILNTAGVANDLDQLYTTALQNSADWSNGSFAQVACCVLGALILSRVPVTDEIIDQLLAFKRGRAAEVLDYLGCVVQWSPGKTARILHASFSDYLTIADRSGCHPWFVDTRIQSKALAFGCLQILKSQLCFNIAKLENSHILNVDIPDLSDHIKAHISAEVNYASQFWAHHLCKTGIDDKSLFELRTFMNVHFLHWLEVLSLLNQVPVATESLKAFQDYTAVSQLTVLLVMTNLQSRKKTRTSRIF